MPKLIVLCGLPGSGKSSYAKQISDSFDQNAEILSSDELRIELFGDVNHQDDNAKVFVELHRRAKEYLEKGRNVIYDATNISAKRRMATLQQFKNCEKIIYYFSTSYEDCIHHDINRSRTVGESVIDRMYRSLQIPSYNEGWDKIYIMSDEHGMMDHYRREFEDIVFNPMMHHDKMFRELSEYDPYTFYPITNLPHDSKWHTLSVSRHIYHVWRYTMDNYTGPDLKTMLLAAIFHDVGKKHTKEFKRGSRYANFIGHEHVSAQLACSFMCWIGYDKNYIIEVCELVNLHMRLLNAVDGDGTSEKLLKYVGEKTYNRLLFLREADTQAH